MSIDLAKEDVFLLSKGPAKVKKSPSRLNEFINKILKEEGMDYIIAIDTDSVYITFERIVSAIYEDKEVQPEEIVDFLDKYDMLHE